MRIISGLFAAILCLASCVGSTAKPELPPPDPAADIKVAPPVIPGRKFNIVDFGGVGDGEKLNTDAFKKAVAAISIAGGGHHAEASRSIN